MVYRKSSRIFFKPTNILEMKPDLIKKIRKTIQKYYFKYSKNLMLLLVFVLSDPFWYDGLPMEGCRVLLHFAATLLLSHSFPRPHITHWRCLPRTLSFSLCLSISDLIPSEKLQFTQMVKCLKYLWRSFDSKFIWCWFKIGRIRNNHWMYLTQGCSLV